MDRSNPEPDSEQAVYRIEVQGVLDENWLDWFGGMTLSVRSESKDLHTTAFTCAVADQAALRGILNKTWDLNLTLISVNRIETGLVDALEAGGVA